MQREKVKEKVKENEDFFDYKNILFKNAANLHFGKGVSPCHLCQKLRFFHLLFLWKMHREKVFSELLERK